MQNVCLPHDIYRWHNYLYDDTAKHEIPKLELHIQPFEILSPKFSDPWINLESLNLRTIAMHATFQPYRCKTDGDVGL